MKQYVYATYNKTIKKFEVPHYQIMASDDYYESIRNAILLGKVEKKNVKNTELYLLGEFEDKTGAFHLTSEPQLVGGFDDLVEDE